MGNCTNSKKQKQNNDVEIFISDSYLSDSEDQDYKNKKNKNSINEMKMNVIGSSKLRQYIVKNDLKKGKSQGHIMKQPQVLYLPYLERSQKKKEQEKQQQNQQPEFSKSLTLITEHRFQYRYNY